MELYKEYQCPGCVSCSADGCFTPDTIGVGCKSHVAGTFLLGPGKVFFGLPQGFNRLGPFGNMKLFIFESFAQCTESWEYDIFNVPVWKHLDNNGNTLVRGLSPRVNTPFLHIIQGDCIADINCAEITAEHLMD